MARCVLILHLSKPRQEPRLLNLPHHFHNASQRSGTICIPPHQARPLVPGNRAVCEGDRALRHSRSSRPSTRCRFSGLQVLHIRCPRVERSCRPPILYLRCTSRRERSIPSPPLPDYCRNRIRTLPRTIPPGQRCHRMEVAKTSSAICRSRVVQIR